MGIRARLHSLKLVSPGGFAVFRVGFGAWVALQFAVLVPWRAELAPGWAGTAILAGGVGSALLLAAGWRRGWTAFAAWASWAALHGLNPLIVTPATAYVGLLLLLLALVPDGEPWRWRGRALAPSAWAMPAGVFAAAWVLMALNYSCIGAAKFFSPSWRDGTAFTHVLLDPMARPGTVRSWVLDWPRWMHAGITWGTMVAQAGFAPLCLWRRGRLVAWSSMVLMHLGLLPLMNFTPLTLGLLWLHVFTFDPAWVSARRFAAGRAVLLYDGECGLCNAVVRWLLREDTAAVLRFAPLQGTFGQEALRRRGLPTRDFDSLVFLPDAEAPDHRLRTAGVLDVLGALGGGWRVAAAAARVVPAPIRDLGYRLVARTRYALFGEYRPTPLPEPAWAERILP